MYGLQTAWFNQSARRRLDGFHARCLRQTLGILPSFLSRISNATVLQQAGATKASSTLLLRQLQLFGRLATSPGTFPVRAGLFAGSSLEIKALFGQRRRGRPRSYWPEMVRAHAVAAGGGEDNMEQLLSVQNGGKNSKWLKLIQDYCKHV